MGRCESKELDYKGTGRIYQNVVRNPLLSVKAKGMYALLSSISDKNDECSPDIETLCEELNITKTTMYKYMNELVEYGVVEKKLTYSGNLKNRVIYKLTHEVRA